MKDKLGIIIALVSVVSISFGAYFFVEERYALSADLKKVEQRLDYKIVADQLRSIQNRIWQIEDRCGATPKDKTTQEELRSLKQDKDALTEKLKQMEKK